MVGQIAWGYGCEGEGRTTSNRVQHQSPRQPDDILVRIARPCQIGNHSGQVVAQSAVTA